MIPAVSWQKNYLQLIDQTRLPEETLFLRIETIGEVFEAIRQLKVRGAPAIGITAGYGLFLGMREVQSGSGKDFFERLDQQIAYLASARPTAVNLFWAMESLRLRLGAMTDAPWERLLDTLLELAIELHQDDRQRCENIADHGQAVVPEQARILTICNTGALATGGIGTALGVIFRAFQRGRLREVYASETRPVLQGARLTVWELVTAGVPVQLISDNMAAALMQQKKTDLVIAGADRIAADGAAANKIGTYSLAVLAQYHQVPFYIAAPLSTFDLQISRGHHIPIEMRPADEIRRVFDQCLITVPDVPCWNPAFDVTPPELISGIITEKGIIRPPYPENIQQIFQQ